MAENTTPSSVACLVCKIAFNSTAELAIHEFSKRHCDNLLRSSKNQPVKQKTVKPAVPPPPPSVDKNATAVIEPAPTVNLSLYGYFDGTQTVEKEKEFNTEYDPYLQKLAENPFKEQMIMPTQNVTSFSTSKRKKKRMCAICNVDCLNIPEYDKHMKSAQHILRMKMSGMGVSAHFVKAGTDLHTTDTVASAAGEANSTAGSPAASSSTEAPTAAPVAPCELYCDVCHLLLNSQGQFAAHVAGKIHNDNVRKAEKKTVVHNPVPNQLFCYTCRLPLNTILQYSDHKKGKKHHSKCRQLIRDGYTIPPEERPDDMPWSGPRRNTVIRYPELYQQFIDKQKEDAAAKLMPPPPAPTPTIGPVQPPTAAATTKAKAQPVPEVNSITGMHHCPHCSDRFATANKLETHMKTHKSTTTSSTAPVSKPAASATPSSSTAPTATTPTSSKASASSPVTKNAMEGSGFSCSVCKLNFTHQPPFEMHLNSEEHALKIHEVKKAGSSSKQLLDMLMADRKVIRGDRWTRFCCGICAVVSHTTEELEQHVKSVLHKYTEKDYSKKRLIEIQQSIAPNSEGKFTCSLCKEDFQQVTLFNAHLHSTQHRNLFWKEHIKKNYIKRWLYTRPGAPFRFRPSFQPKNPGIRTKVAGVAKNLTSGIVVPVPNLEQIEPKIDPSKNVQLGDTPAPTAEEQKVKQAKKNKKTQTLMPPRRLPGMRLMPARRMPGMVYKKSSRPPPVRPVSFIPESGPWVPPERRFLPGEEWYNDDERFREDDDVFEPPRYVEREWERFLRDEFQPPVDAFHYDRYPEEERFRYNEIEPPAWYHEGERRFGPPRFPGPRMPLRSPFLANRPRPPPRFAPYRLPPRGMPPRFMGPPRGPRMWW